MAYRNSKKYREIWEKANGRIPPGYEIHHIDGDRDNNSLENLTCVSIQEHYDIHYKQGDLEACHAISLRINKKPLKGWRHSLETINKLRKPKKNKEGYKKTEEQKRRIGDANRGRKLPPISEETRQKRKKPKSEIFKKRVSDALMGVKKTQIQCPHCGVVGGVNIMQRHHFSNCEHLTGVPLTQRIIKCPFCDKEGGVSNMKRYHFNNCKQKTDKI